MSDQGMPPAGWYPEGDGWERWWDGAAWTDERRPVAGDGRAPDASTAPRSPRSGDDGDVAQAPDGGPAEPFAPPAPGIGGTPGSGQGPTGWPTQGPADLPPPTGGGYGAIGGGPSPLPPGPGMPGPGMPGPGMPGQGFGGGRPPGKKKSLLWLWISLAVVLVLVLVIGAGATLAVTQPWADDEDSAKKDDSSEKDGDSSDDPTDSDPDGGSEGLAARSDFNGDGLGDLVGIFFSGESWAQVTLTSGDGAFEVEQAPGASANLLWEDWDGDGTATAITWKYASYDNGLTIESAVGDFPEESWNDFQLWDETDIWMRVDSGDFDGDGTKDLAVMGQTRPKQVKLWVMKGTGDGFEAPDEWATLENATYGSTQIFPGDFDGDGTDDLLTLLPTKPNSIKGEDRDRSFYYGAMGTKLYRSTGSGFEPESSQLGESPFDDDSVAMPERYALGDFAGTGTPMIAMQDPSYRTTDVLFFEYDDGDLVQSDLEGDADGRVRGIGAADVNGDGRDDVVAAIPDAERSEDVTELQLQVLVSEGESIADPAVWGALPCEDSCAMTFDKSSR